MSRRRYLSTDISADSKMAGLSLLAGLLYTWGIPHAGDDCRLTAKNADECRWTILPNQACTTEQVQAAIDELIGRRLWGIDEAGRLFYPSKSFYKYQTYIPKSKQQETPQISDNHRESAQNTVSPSPSPSEELLLKDSNNSSCPASSTPDEKSPKGNPEKPKKPKKLPSEEGKAASQLLSDLIGLNFPSRTKPTEAQLTEWAYEAERIERIDEHPWQEIRALIEWSQKDPFWKANILSIEKLRKQWTQLTAMKAREESHGSQSSAGNRVAPPAGKYSGVGG